MTALCHRCEHRAEYLETGHAPRCECQDVGQAVCSCYAYLPVRPVVLARNDDDDRPVFAGMLFSARSHAVGVAEGHWRACQLVSDGYVSWFEPALPRRRHWWRVKGWLRRALDFLRRCFWRVFYRFSKEEW